MKYFIGLTLLLFSQFTFSQTLEEIELCTALQSNQFYSEVEADSALDRILDASGLAKNFTLTQCDNIDNAAAISYKGVRYILYDKEFLQTITDYTNDWANLFILAHEVGHHLNGHSVDVSMLNIVESKTLEDKRKQELEADEFAAFVLAQLGAPLRSVIEPIELVTSNKEDTHSTHPNKIKRLNAIRRGYQKGFSKTSKRSIDISLGNKPKRESNLPKWGSQDFRNNPFRDWDYISSIKGDQDFEGAVIPSEFVISYDSNKYVEGNYKTIIYASLNLLIDDRFKKLMEKRYESYVDGIVDRVLQQNVNIRAELTVAIDGDIIFVEERPFGSFATKDFSKYNYYPDRNEVYTAVHRDTNIPRWQLNSEQNNYRKLSNRFISKLKSGSKLYLRYNIFEDLRFYSDTKSDSEIFESLIFEFSLNGSSEALSGLNELPIRNDY